MHTFLSCRGFEPPKPPSGYATANVYVRFNYDQLCIDKALVNFRKSDNNISKNKNNVRTL